MAYIRRDKHQNTTKKLVFPRQHKDNSLKMPSQRERQLKTLLELQEFLSDSRNENFS